jgi:hypothetical protein
MREGGDDGDIGHDSGDPGSLIGSSFTTTGESASLDRPVAVLSWMHGKHSFSISATQNITLPSVPFLKLDLSWLMQQCISGGE